MSEELMKAELERARALHMVIRVIDHGHRDENDNCGVCAQLAVALMERAREAAKDRDFEWWEKLALVDNVAPTPEAVREWLLDVAEHEREGAVKAATEELWKLRDRACAECLITADRERQAREKAEKERDELRALATSQSDALIVYRQERDEAQATTARVTRTAIQAISSPCDAHQPMFKLMSFDEFLAKYHRCLGCLVDGSPSQNGTPTGGDK